MKRLIVRPSHQSTAAGFLPSAVRAGDIDRQRRPPGTQQQRSSAANASSVTLNTVLFKEAQNKFSDADFVAELTRTLAIANRSCVTKRPTEVIILPSQYRQSRDPNQRNYPQA